MVACMSMHTTTHTNIDPRQLTGEHATRRRRRWTWGRKLEVRLKDGAPQAGARMEVVAPNGWRVRIGDEFAGEALRRVLHLVGQC